MERLTEKHYLGTDHYMKCSGNCNVDMDCIDCPSFDRLVERLAAYEDTGLTPEEIKELLHDTTGPLHRKLGEWIDADASGKLAVLRWIPVTERMPEEDMKLLLYVPKTEKGRQSGIFTGELKEVKANNGSGNFWNIPTPGSDWTLWGWSYFEKPNVTHWMPLPEAPDKKALEEQK